MSPEQYIQLLRDQMITLRQDQILPDSMVLGDLDQIDTYLDGLATALATGQRDAARGATPTALIIQGLKQTISEAADLLDAVLDGATYADKSTDKVCPAGAVEKVRDRLKAAV